MRAYYVGFFNDDAFFIIGARSFLQGRFVELNAPGQPALTNYMPGYSLLLAPLALFGRYANILYQLLSVGLSLASLVLLWKSIRDDEPFDVAIPALLLTAFNPLMVSLSGTVLSDIPYLTFSLLFFVAAERVWSKKNQRDMILLACLAAFLFYLRPVGGAVGGAFLLALLSEKRFKQATICLGVLLILILPFLLRNYLAKGYWLWYGVEFAESYQPAVGPNAAFYLRELFIRTFFRWPGAHPILETATIAACVIATIAGSFQIRREKSFRVMLGVYLAVYIAVHLVWHRQSARYLYPLVPFAAVALFRGGKSLENRIPKLRGLNWGVLAVALLLCFVPVKRIVHASLALKTPVTTPPLATLAWIDANTQSTATFACEADGQIYLLTGRQTIALPKGLSPADFSLWLARGGMDYVYVARMDFVLRSQQGGKRHDPMTADALIRALNEHRSFELAFSNEEEGTAIYKRIR